MQHEIWSVHLDQQFQHHSVFLKGDEEQEESGEEGNSGGGGGGVGGGMWSAMSSEIPN